MCIGVDTRALTYTTIRVFNRIYRHALSIATSIVAHPCTPPLCRPVNTRVLLVVVLNLFYKRRYQQLQPTSITIISIAHMSHNHRRHHHGSIVVIANTIMRPFMLMIATRTGTTITDITNVVVAVITVIVVIIIMIGTISLASVCVLTIAMCCQVITITIIIVTTA